jgi:uncharacterized protein (DUF433 family)
MPEMVSPVTPGSANSKLLSRPRHRLRGRARGARSADEEVVRHALERLEAALRARTAAGPSDRAGRALHRGGPAPRRTPLIYFRDGEAGRRPTLLGTRLDVADVLTTIKQNDNSVEETAGYLEIPPEHVDACLGYYADYKDEIDAWIERSRAIAERERERWQRRQQALDGLHLRRDDAPQQRRGPSVGASANQPPCRPHR